MLHHLDRVRFASFVFSALFRNTFVCSAAWQNRQTGSQPGKPTGCRHCKLSFAFASCSNASSAGSTAASAANAQLLAMVKRCSSPSRIFFVRCAAVFTFSLSPAASIYRLPRGLVVRGSAVTTSGFGRRVWSVLLLCYALPLDNCAVDCPHFRLEIILKTFTQLALYMCPACPSVRLSDCLSVCLSILLLLLLLLLHWLSACRCLLHRIACSAACFCLPARPRPHLACGSALCLHCSLCSLNACYDRTLLQLH